MMKVSSHDRSLALRAGGGRWARAGEGKACMEGVAGMEEEKEGSEGDEKAGGCPLVGVTSPPARAPADAIEEEEEEGPGGADALKDDSGREEEDAGAVLVTMDQSSAWLTSAPPPPPR